MSQLPLEEAPPPDLVGTVINERYQVLERLGEGGMGVVYKARHLALDSLVAVKVLLAPQEAESQEQFLIEARLASKISHPNTVYIADFGVLPDGRAYIAMEFLGGPTLGRLLKSGPIDVLRACRLSIQVARGLQAVHDKDVIHRDLKPDNVFVLEQDGKKDFVKLVDFGIAKAVGEGPFVADSATEKHPHENSVPAHLLAAGADEDGLTGGRTRTTHEAVVGTPIYMAPEQVRGQKLDVRVDQYALGCMLFQMLAGQVPFDGGNANGTMMAHLFEPVPTLKAKNPNCSVPESIEALMRRLMAKTPGERFDSMRQVEEALEREVDLLLVQRGERVVLPTAVAGLLSKRARGTHIIIGGRRLPLWAIAPVAVALILGGVFIAYPLLRTKGGRQTLRPHELEQLRQAAMRVLLDGADHGPLELRQAALSGLAQSHDASQRSHIESFLNSSERELKAQAAEALASLGERSAIPALLAALDKTQDSAVRAGLASALSQLGESRGQAALNEMLSGKDGDARLRAALALCEQGPPSAQELLRSVAKQEQVPEPLRQSALACLAQNYSANGANRTDALAALRMRMGGKRSIGERAAAAAKLMAIGDEGGRDFLREWAKKSGPDKLAVARLLASPEEFSTAELFRHVLADSASSGPARQLAAEGLGLSGELFDVRLLGMQLGAQGEPFLRVASAGSIVQLAAQDPSQLSVQSFGWARSALQDRSALIRQAAALALADSRAPGAVPLLVGLLTDREPGVRRSVVRALGRRSGGEALSSLHSGLSDSDAGVREEALRSMGRIALSLPRSRAAALLSEVTSWVRSLIEKGSNKEQLLARSILLRLGDGLQLAPLKGFESSADVELRRLLIEQIGEDADLLSRALQDAAFAVRFAAARRLAEHGDRRALPILREALEQPGPERFIAAGLLRRSGELVGIPTDLDSTLRSADPDRRVAAVEALAQSPPEIAAPLLFTAARDPEPDVRSAVAEAAAELGSANGGLAILRRLLSDINAGVRARAAALLSGLPTMDKSVEAPPIATSSRTPEPAQIPNGSEQEVESDAATTSAVDAGIQEPDAGAAAIPVVPVETGDTPAEDAGPGALAEQLLRSGRESLARHDYRKAQRQLEKASALCSRSRKASVSCPGLISEAALRLGEIHEAQKEFGEAMAAYQRVLDAPSGKGAGGRVDAKTRAAAQLAVDRLSQVLGRVEISHKEKGHCKKVTLWLDPGTHMVKMGQSFETIQVRAKERVAVGSCD